MDQKVKELIETYDNYIRLLGCEIDELSSIATVHGWTSKRVKEGAICRIKIEDLKRDLERRG